MSDCFKLSKKDMSWDCLFVGIVIDLLLDVDTFAGGLFSKLAKRKDPHRKN